MVVTSEGIEGVATETGNTGGASEMTDQVFLLYLSGDVKNVGFIIMYEALTMKLNDF